MEILFHLKGHENGMDVHRMDKRVKRGREREVRMDGWWMETKDVSVRSESGRGREKFERSVKWYENVIICHEF